MIYQWPSVVGMYVIIADFSTVNDRQLSAVDKIQAL